MKISIQKLELVLNYKIKRNFKGIALDVATKAGFCTVTTDEEYAHFDWSFLHIDTKDVKEKYKIFVQTYEEIIKKGYFAVIEDTHLVFFGKFPQVSVLKELTRYHTFAVAEAIKKNVPYELIGATSYRSKLGISTKGFGRGGAKDAVAYWLKNNFKLDIQEDNVADAFVLSLTTICDNFDFSPVAKPKKKRAKKKKFKKVMTKSAKIVQVKNPKTGKYVKIDKSKGSIIAHKKTKGAYKNIPIVKAKKK